MRPAFNLVFMDPPYNKHLIGPSLTNLHHSGCLESGACVTIEHSRLEPIAESPLPRISSARLLSPEIRERLGLRPVSLARSA